MTKQIGPEQVAERVHMSIQAWFRFLPNSLAPCGATILKKTMRSTVCRIEGVGPGGSHIVAKWCPQADGELETFVYREVLARLSMASIHCYGFIKDGLGDYGWLFLEDAGTAQAAPKGECFPPDFSTWLAHLHTSASLLPISGRLPARGPSWYLGILRHGQSHLLECLRKRNLDICDRSAIEQLLICLETLEEHWRSVEERCECLPWTMVHCDIQPKNILTRSSPHGIEFLPLDWEDAGWGPPAADLSRVDAERYLSAAQKTWPRLELREIEVQARCGVVFSLLSAVDWEMLRLAAGSEEKALRRLRVYAPRLSASTQALGLEVYAYAKLRRGLAGHRGA